MVLAYDIESFLSTISDLDNLKSFIILFAMSSYVFFFVVFMNCQEYLNPERVVIEYWYASSLLMVFSTSNPKAKISSVKTDIACGSFCYFIPVSIFCRVYAVY